MQRVWEQSRRRDTEDSVRVSDPCEKSVLGKEHQCLDIRSLEAGDINVLQTVILFISLQGGALPQSDHTNIK